MDYYHLVKKGAEAEIYLVNWYGKKAISKIRTRKNYINTILDLSIRKRRTVHEIQMIHNSRKAGVRSPFIFFVDLKKSEIIMEFIDGRLLKDILTIELCGKLGKNLALLHEKNIIHGDPTTSNFIHENNNMKLAVIDFGLSFFSERFEDRAVDIRLFKETLNSYHVNLFDKAYQNFLENYALIIGEKKFKKIINSLDEIEKRGRYARSKI